MSDATSFAELDLDRQHAELLPARTVLSLLSAVDAGDPGAPGESIPGSGSTTPLLLGYQQGGSAQGR